ncbi:MAG TPA: LysR family transcriptional regulator [Candidatus Bathyarchaeota archaeon]|nr:LysR family transcriptional regulator [Candidatus Bathyarchaeota archaeon]
MPTSKSKRKPLCKIWIESKGEPVLGKGGAEILKAVKAEKSITKAAEKLGMSYRYVWNYIHGVSQTVGKPVVETFKGGKHGGGGAKLTATGERLLREYERWEKYVGKVLHDTEGWEALSLKISARNRLKGTVKEVEKDAVTAKVKIEIATPVVLTALISREAVEELEIKPGDNVEAVVKATEVMVAK